jgi:DNA-binding NarL/FixJ family response regulator
LDRSGGKVDDEDGSHPATGSWDVCIWRRCLPISDHRSTSDHALETLVIRFLLVEDHIALREPLAFMIEREPDMTVVGQAGDLAEARRQLESVDIALVDLQLPDGSGVELIRDLRIRNRNAQAIVLTATTDPLAHARAYEAGAALVLHKSTRAAEIVTATRRVWAGEQLVPPSTIIDMLRLLGQQREEARETRRAVAELTPREMDVLHALARGLSDKEIAADFSLSDRTVRNHVVSVLDKLGVDSRLQAVLLALRIGIVTLEEPPLLL